MIKHKLYSKGEYVHALISCDARPNILFPVRALIYDVKFDEINPRYQIKIVKFYDNIYFLKKYLFGGMFQRGFETGEKTRINLQRKEFRTIEDLTNRVFDGEKWKKYLIVVDSVFCTKTRAEQVELFNNLQTFFIQIKLREVFELANRNAYSKGQFYWQTKGTYEKSLQKFLGDRYPNDEGWIEDLLYRPDTDELDSAEWGSS